MQKAKAEQLKIQLEFTLGIDLDIFAYTIASADRAQLSRKCKRNGFFITFKLVHISVSATVFHTYDVSGLDWIWLQFLNSYELNWKIIGKYCVVIKIKIFSLLLYYIIKIMYIFIFFKIFPSSFSIYLLKIYPTKNAA